MKPKREITLGEMQDECKTRVKCCTGCPYKEVCGEIPKFIDLTDPPRFTEAQMALLKALWENGAGYAFKAEQGIVFLSQDGTTPIMSLNIFGSSQLTDEIGCGTYLAELFGKEGK